MSGGLCKVPTGLPKSSNWGAATARGTQCVDTRTVPCALPLLNKEVATITVYLPPQQAARTAYHGMCGTWRGMGTSAKPGAKAGIPRARYCKGWGLGHHCEYQHPLPTPLQHNYTSRMPEGTRIRCRLLGWT